MSKLRNALIGAGALGGLAAIGVAAFPEEQFHGSTYIGARDKKWVMLESSSSRDFGFAKVITQNSQLFNASANQVCLKEKTIVSSNHSKVESEMKETCRPIQKGDLPDEILEEMKKHRKSAALAPSGL